MTLSLLPTKGGHDDSSGVRLRIYCSAVLVSFFLGLCTASNISNTVVSPFRLLILGKALLGGERSRVVKIVLLWVAVLFVAGGVVFGCIFGALGIVGVPPVHTPLVA